MSESPPTQLRTGTPILTVGDIQASIGWYTDILGLELAQEWKTDSGEVMGATLTAGGLDFNLAQDDFAKGKDRVKGVGLRLYCETDQDVDQLAADIKGRGGSLDHEPTTQPWGARDFGITDPDGFKISIANPQSAGA
ncbi:MAG: VOC family protein [Longimicrobiales bacterium]